ncbi:repeat element 34 protein [Diadegma fenestrale ichnovirus]|nr:repeat element 34 protein [Diadegma fenestrale ichnovirus]
MAERGSEPRQLPLPLDIFIYMSKFLDFEDYRNFIRAFIPIGEENEYIRRRLWQLSTHKYDATFCNKKQLEIEYNFDPARMPEDRVLVNVESLLPVFGGIVPSDTPQFTSTTQLYDFVRCHVHLDMCTEQYYSSCFCKGIRENQDFTLFLQECSFEHFHHFCWRHVAWWLEDLNTSIILEESKNAAMRLALQTPIIFQNRLSCLSRLITRVRDCWCKKCWPKRVWRLTD